MKSAYERLEHGLAAAAARFEPGPLLEWQQLSHPRGAVAMRAQFGTVDGMRIRYAASEPPAERTVLLTSPWPESLYAYAPIWPTLTAQFRVVAVDLPGFGASEARPELRSPRAMGAFLIGLIDEWELDRPHLVGPGVGTPAALFAALLSPGSVSSVVVGSGAAAVPVELGPPLRDWTLDPNLDRLRQLDPNAVVDAALSTVAGHEFPQAIREDYYSCYAGGRFAESIGYARRYPDELPELAARLGEIKKPVMVFAGLRDRVVPLSNAEFLAERLPNCRQATLGAGHFVWEEAPDAFAQLLCRWIDEHDYEPPEAVDVQYADPQ